MSTANLIKKLEEIKKKIVIRQGKKIKINQPKEGYRVVGNKYVKIQPGEARARSKAAIRAARGRRGKQSQANRQRAKSMRKRASMGEAAFGFESDEYEYFDANDSIYEYEDECECDDCQMGLPCPCDELEESVDLNEVQQTSGFEDQEQLLNAIILYFWDNATEEDIAEIQGAVSRNINLETASLSIYDRLLTKLIGKHELEALWDIWLKTTDFNYVYNHFRNNIIGHKVKYSKDSNSKFNRNFMDESFLNEACPEGSDPRGGKCARSDKSGYLKGKCDKGYIWDTKRDTCERMAKESKLSKYFSYKV